MGKLLKDPKFIPSFKRLNKALRRDHSCNQSLKNIIKRSLCHYHFPHIKEEESQNLKAYSMGKIKAQEVLLKIENLLKTLS